MEKSEVKMEVQHSHPGKVIKNPAEAGWFNDVEM
jgi:hypothetical protein